MQYNVRMKSETALTIATVSGTHRKMGRKKLWSDKRINLTVPEGMHETIAAALHEGEDTLAFIREAIGRELKRRQKEKR